MIRIFLNFSIMVSGCVSQDIDTINTAKSRVLVPLNTESQGRETDGAISEEIQYRLDRQASICLETGGSWNPTLINCQCSTGSGFRKNAGCLPGSQLLSKNDSSNNLQTSSELNWSDSFTSASGLLFYQRNKNPKKEISNIHTQRTYPRARSNFILEQVTFPDNADFSNGPVFIIGCSRWLKKIATIENLVPILAGDPFAIDATYMGIEDLDCKDDSSPSTTHASSNEDIVDINSKERSIHIGTVMNQFQQIMKQKSKNGLNLAWHLSGGTDPDEIVQTATAVFDGFEVVSIVALRAEVPFLRAVTVKTLENPWGTWVRTINALGETIYTSFTTTMPLPYSHKNSKERVTFFYDESMNIISSASHREYGSKDRFISDVSTLEARQHKRELEPNSNLNINILLIDQGIDLSAPVIQKHFNASPDVLREFLSSHKANESWKGTTTKPTEDVLSWQSDSNLSHTHHGTDVASVALNGLDSSYRLYYTNGGRLPVEPPADILTDPLYLDIVEKNIKVVNISIIWDYNYPGCVDYFSRLANALREQTIFIAGAGNTGGFHPQGFCLARAARSAKNILVVAGSDVTMNMHKNTTYGPAAAHLVAPFLVRVLRPEVQETGLAWTRVNYQAGTSFSAPAVANMVLRRLRSQPEQLPVKLAEELKSSCYDEGLPVYCGGHIDFSKFMSHAN